MTITALALWTVYSVYVARTERHRLEHHLFLLWVALAVVGIGLPVWQHLSRG
ncbi:MAG TPA: hypothetical protein VIT92_14510 [Burkholderiaceae bacterium]